MRCKKILFASRMIIERIAGFQKRAYIWSEGKAVSFNGQEGSVSDESQKSSGRQKSNSEREEAYFCSGETASVMSNRTRC